MQGFVVARKTEGWLSPLPPSPAMAARSLLLPSPWLLLLPPRAPMDAARGRPEGVVKSRVCC